MEKILESVLQKIRPSKKEEERIRKFVSNLIDVSKNVTGMDVAVVGSIGKFTWLSGDHDIDIFIMFSKNTSREELETRGLELGANIVNELRGRAHVKYAEHPYTHAVIQGFDVDIVPCYRIQKGEHIQSAVDRSPLHLQYVLDHMSPRMQDQARLLKQFCKGIGTYGSDAKNLGFSGYICELLIMHYQNFEAAVRAAAAWQAPQIIDIAGFNKHSFAGQPLVIIDPVDKDRNAAAVVSVENFLRFVAACRQFKAAPNASFFSQKPVQPLSEKQSKYLMNRGTRFIAVKMATPNVIEDVLYPQLRKATKRLENLIHHNEFSTLRSYEFAGRECWLIFELEIFELPPINNQEGPPIFSHQHSQQFLSKYKGKNFIYIEEDRLVAEVKREYRTPQQLLEGFLRREKGKLAEDGLPTYIAGVAAQSSILVHDKFFAAVKRDKQLSSFLREKYFVDMGKML